MVTMTSPCRGAVLGWAIRTLEKQDRVITMCDVADFVSADPAITEAINTCFAWPNLIIYRLL